MIDDHLPDAPHVALRARQPVSERFLRLRRQVPRGFRSFLSSFSADDRLDRVTKALAAVLKSS